MKEDPKLKDFDNYFLVRELEARGAVICQWWPEDVLYAQGVEEPDHTKEWLDRAEEWLKENRDDLMTAGYTEGNRFIGMADEIVSPEEPEE